MKPVKQGSIVKYQGGWLRVSRLTKTAVNLAGIFSGKVVHKDIPLADVVEDEANWYQHWSNSETYRSM